MADLNDILINPEFWVHAYVDESGRPSISDEQYLMKIIKRSFDNGSIMKGEAGENLLYFSYLITFNPYYRSLIQSLSNTEV